MSETMSTESVASESEKPVSMEDDVKFPPFPEPTDDDFEEDIGEEERKYYKEVYPDLNLIKNARLHCTACDRHLGNSIRNEGRMRAHPMLRTLVCHTCHTFYNSGEFEKGDDGSELYCRWCGQGGQVYCCSDCPHVFCAKCIKRNMGVTKIKEIENTDDWKCFKCNPRCLWDLRALCWALLRYCDLKNKMLYQTQDPMLRELYIKDSAVDHTECCKSKRRKEKKKESENTNNKTSPVPKLPPSIQVKKFASINVDEVQKKEKKATKRPLSPKYKPILIKNAIPAASGTPPMKKIRGPNLTAINPVRFSNDGKVAGFSRIKPKPTQMGIMNNFNGFDANFGSMSHSMVVNFNDNLNLSLDSLTQGLDMSAVAHLTNTEKNNDVVCTPDLPLEPLCEVTEDNDDDVECITPGPSRMPRPNMKNPPPLVPRSVPSVSNQKDLSFENIIQMTENDVTINETTGGLKFRVDPQTLSSNKMYRLPDGRIFAINVNPSMPGGYSATIVALSDSSKAPGKGSVYAAKLSTVTQTPSPAAPKRRQNKSVLTPKPISNKAKDTVNKNSRQCDFNVPVEWFRYNLLDAIDCLEYSLARLNKLKKDASTMHLRTRTIDEMRGLHRNLERLLNTSSCRFVEIRQNMNKEFKQYIIKKKLEETSHQSQDEDDDDDVEILPDENEGPIFIDETSLDSHHENQEVDLTGAGSSEHNDSAENKDTNTLDISDHEMETATTNTTNVVNVDTQYITIKNNLNEAHLENKVDGKESKPNENEKHIEEVTTDFTAENRSIKSLQNDSVEINGDLVNTNDEQDVDSKAVDISKDNDLSKDGVLMRDEELSKEENEVESKKDLLKDVDDKETTQESEISEEMIESLLKDDSMGANNETVKTPPNSMDVSEN